MPGLEHHERADYLDEIELLRTQRDQLSSSVQAVVMNIGMLARVGGTLALLGTVHPALVLLPLFGIPSLLTAATAERRRQRTMEAIAEPLRVTRHLLELTTTAAPAKELRLFGLGPVLVGRHRALWQELDQIQDRTARRNALLSMTGWSVFGIGFVGALAIVAERAINGQASPGDVVLALTLAGQVNSQVSGVVHDGDVADLVAEDRRPLPLAGRLRGTTRSSPTRRPRPRPTTSSTGSSFEHVDVPRIPPPMSMCCSDVSLHIPAGATVAVVGDNGAGKSTLVKLLCRFYDPTEGVISVDGVDLRRIDPWDWRARLSAGFQDFARFELLGARDRRRRPPRSSQRPRRDRRRARPRVGRRT